MRIPSFPTILRTFYTVSNTTRLLPQFNATSALQPLYSKAALAYNPSMGFISSFFTSTPKQEMSFPVNKTKNEWQAVLSPGMCASLYCGVAQHDLRRITSPPIPMRAHSTEQHN